MITIPIEAGKITLFSNELKMLVLVSVSVNSTKKLLVLRRIVDRVGTKPFDEKKSKTQNINFWINSWKILVSSSRKLITVLSMFFYSRESGFLLSYQWMRFCFPFHNPNEPEIIENLKSDKKIGGPMGYLFFRRGNIRIFVLVESQCDQILTFNAWKVKCIILDIGAIF